jgi:hypothetical protein
MALRAVATTVVITVATGMLIIVMAVTVVQAIMATATQVAGMGSTAFAGSRR